MSSAPNYSIHHKPRNQVDTLSLYHVPVSLLYVGSNSVKLYCRDFTIPIVFDSLLDLAIGTWFYDNQWNRKNILWEGAHQCEENQGRWNKPFFECER